MIHPYALHAYTALISLAASWPHLRRATAAVSLEASDCLRSPIYGLTRTSGISDGGILAAVQAGVTEHNRWTELRQHAADHVAQAVILARSAAPGIRGGPLSTIAHALPAASPSTARDIGHYLWDADRAIRTRLALPPDRQLLVGVPCPVCEVRLLSACTTSPHRAAWTVLCGADCRCTGKTCPCVTSGSVPAYGVAHIWRWTVIAARTAVPAGQ